MKAFWIATGVEVAQTALWFGVDDLDGTVQEEKIYHMAGARTPERDDDASSSSGWSAPRPREPVERDCPLQRRPRAVGLASPLAETPSRQQRRARRGVPPGREIVICFGRVFSTRGFAKSFTMVVGNVSKHSMHSIPLLTG